MENSKAFKLDNGQFAELASSVLRSLPGDIDSVTAQCWIENQSALRKVLREALLPPQELLRN